MSTTTLTSPTPTRLPAVARVGAGLALPLGVMNGVGAVVFWEWSWLALVSLLALALGAATLAGAVQTLRSRRSGLHLLRRAMLAQVCFTLMKLVFWAEVEALPFGVVALVILAMVASRD